MAQPREQVHAVMEVLTKHWELVAEGLSGPVMAGERGRAKQVEALAGVHALLPYEEDVYHLNPRLRAYLADHLAFFGAFQTVTRLSEHILRARNQWAQIKEIKREGSLKDMDKMEWALDDTVSDIVYFMEQNLVLLNSMVFTRYGNVATLKAKKAQNRFYGTEVKICLRELQSVDQMVEEIGSEAVGVGMPGTRQVVNGRLRSRLSGWVARLNDIQAVITKRLFLAKKLEQRLRNLSAVSLWLVRNPTRGGVAVPVDEKAPVGLFVPAVIKISPQIDFTVSTGVTAEAMQAAVARLPKRRDPADAKKPAEPQRVLGAQMEVVDEPMMPEDVAILELLAHLKDAGRAGVSLARWRKGRDSLQSITEEEWLLYAATQLVVARKRVEFVHSTRTAEMLNDPFHDVLALEKA